MTLEGWEPLALAAHCVRSCGEDSDILRTAGAMIRWQFDENAKLRELVRDLSNSVKNHHHPAFCKDFLREAEAALEPK